MPTNRGEINFTSARIAATPAPRRRTCTCTSVAFTLAVLSWKRPQKNWRQSCKTNWALSCRGTPKTTTRTNNAVDYSGLQEWSLHVGLRLYYYFFKKNNFGRNPWQKGDAFVNGTLLILAEPQLERNIAVRDANIRLLSGQKTKRLERAVTSPTRRSLYWTGIQVTCFVSALLHIRMAADH